MAQVLTMPKLSDTMEEGGVAQWLKEDGEKIKAGESLVEIETDKATMEYPSPETGYILKKLVNPGTAVAIGAPLLILGSSKDESFDLDELLKKFAQSLSAPSHSSEASRDQKPAPAALDLTQSAPASSSREPQTLVYGGTAPEDSGRIKASPLAKKLAKEQGVTLSQLKGSGPGGRIIAKDISNASSGHSGAPSPRRAIVLGQNKEVPLSLMRKTIAKRLTSAKNDAPHFYLKRTIDMTAALVLKEEISKSLGQKISINDLIIYATSRALLQHPRVNASWADNKIIEWGDVHIAIAVALEAGLVTPVIRHTDQLGLAAIAQESRQLAMSAKNEKLKNEDYQGGTFTISNLGMLGIEEFTAIINPPQAAILAVGTIRKEAVFDAQGSLKACDRMTIVMSCDHRVVDGAVGAEFLKTLVSYLEKPYLMLA